MIEFDYNKSINKLVIKCDEELFTQLREHFSVEDPNAHFARRRNRFARTRKYLITPTGRCDLGLYWDIRRYLIEKQITTHVIHSKNVQEIVSIDRKWTIFTDFAYELRDYQLEVIERALKLGCGTCVLGTGAGKTLTTAALVENYYRNCNNTVTFKCLVVVPDLGLVNQTFDEFNNVGVSFQHCKWTGNNDYNPESNVIICNAGVLQSRFDDTDWIKYVDLLIVDECHRIKHSNKISNLLSKIKTTNRYGFTGTLPEDIFDKWSIIGKLGPVIYEKNSYELRKEKYLANVEVKVIELQYNEQVPIITKNDYRDELDFIYQHRGRNRIIGEIARKISNNTLILVNHIQHGEILYEYISSISDKKVFFIRGSVDVDERDRIKAIMEENDDVICIAISAIFSTGVNIKNIHNIMFVSGGKSFIRTVQSIGRGLRMHENKSKLIIIDLCDKLKYGLRHGLKRKDIYSQEKIQYNTKCLTVT